MKFTKYVVVLLLPLLFSDCQTFRPRARRVTAEVVLEGWIDCFAPTLAEGKTWCEASAILAQNGQLYLANDKDMPAPQSAVFRFNGLPTDQDAWRRAQPVYSEQSLLRSAHKFEEFAASPDQKWVFLTTAFDRIKPGSAEFNGYNMLFAWPTGQENSPQLLGTNGNSGVSLTLRSQLQKALGNPAYFKVEGLAATNDRLWFGVREQGDTYEKFNYRITILSAPYHAESVSGTGPIPNQKQLMLGPVTFMRDFNVADVDTTLSKPLAISSIEFDPKRHCFWILTSYEQGDKLGAYLWVITEKAMLDKGDLQLVRNANGKPIQFTHKAEDMTFTDTNTLLVIHDDDRVRTRIGTQERQPNQAAYSVVHINE
ncbi:hypothetical protein J2I47_09815 [Fibrella sp. HMF5335]|uniref:Uncharacterized protein n=1 Tax=Fibrella rubiginis TaxID=2817060 RepID=A0A939GGK7_9BACT|nr:hypothetical protein [Fibrella rubiginis]MBO0936839.1 hypothetical protein [Fibrella rubiginis]